MYNRYIPQPDGSYRRNRMQEAQSQPEFRPPASVREPEPAGCGQCIRSAPPRRPAPRPPRPREDTGVGSFLKQLLPKEFETEDLLVVLLLLLMAGDCQENRSNALLTLVLYLFL